MLDHGNGQLSAVGFFNPGLGQAPVGTFFGGGAGGGGGGSSGVFDISGGEIVRCALVFGRQWVKCADTSLDILGEGQTPTGVIYAEVDHSSNKLTLAVKHRADGNLPDNSLQKSYRALYYACSMGSSSVWADVRFMPVMFAMN